LAAHQGVWFRDDEEDGLDRQGGHGGRGDRIGGAGGGFALCLAAQGKRRGGQGEADAPGGPVETD
jgi:hypothetical protein